MGNQSESRLLNLFCIMREELTSDGTRQNLDEETIAEENEFNHAPTRLLSRMRKRAEIVNPALEPAAIRGFITTNDAVGALWGKTRLDPQIERDARLFITESFERFNHSRDPSLIQIPYDPRFLKDLWRFGPGASVGTKATHTAQKICESMSCTALAAPAVTKLRASHPYLYSADLQDGVCGYTLVQGSRLSFVPKNETSLRTIAVEPSGNMALQLALGTYIQMVLRFIGLDITTQEGKNKFLACFGSITDSVVTIDMKSASDMISIWLCKRLLPPALYDAMLRFRSPMAEMPDGTVVKLNMMSTMGNGFTFPLMTLIFVSLIYAIRRSRGGPRNYIDWSRTAVYGDDIIVPRSEADELIEVCESAGFIINRDKSFLSGPFRESCGGDYCNGKDITPFYIERLGTDAEIYIAINKVYGWCARNRHILIKTLTYLRSLLSQEVHLVPEWLGDDAGFRVLSAPRRYKYLEVKVRTSVCFDYRFLVPLAIGGYVTGWDGVTFSFRDSHPKYVTRKARIPKGFLDGSCPISRAASESAYIYTYDWIMTI